MPLLAPSLSPPPSRLLPVISSLQASSMEKSSSIALPTPLAATPNQIHETPIRRIPEVHLDVDFITDVIAARLATSLLGHVLFLKNQVPFPVMQLGRIPNGQSNTRATKMRNELLASFDTLTSHLNTTFTALSTAFALCVSNAKVKNGGEEEKSGCTPDVSIKKKNRAYLAIILGPSVGSAKSRVVFAVDGLEAKVWGVRDDREDLDETGNRDSDSEEEVDSDGEEEDESDEDEENEHSASEDESDLESDNTDESSEPPPPRSPSPLHPKLPSLASTPTLHATVTTASSPTPPGYSYAEEQQALRTADRLLSRTLAAAEGDGKGMACEMAPTQTHILIRAPRRFVHPAWIPRQNVSASLEGILDEFLEESGFGRQERKRKPKRGAKMEGVWIGCRGGLGEDEDGGDNDCDEEDEMIWWSWDGKIVGFGDW